MIARTSSCFGEGRGPVVVVAPHPDDEVLGCGGLLRACHGEGRPTAVVHITCSSEERRSEARAAAAVLGVDDGRELGLPEGQVAAGPGEAQLLRAALEELKAETVLMPAFEDRHPDHRASHRLLAAALAELQREAPDHCPRVVATYEGFSPISGADCWLDISGHAEDKWKALACFGSQDRLYRIGELSRTLNRFRGLSSFRRSVSYAEAFCRFDVPDYLRAAAERCS
jgi:LmbE family N-acetylglucosaminyl deacetylase